MNLLQQVPPPARHIVYAAYALAGVVLGGFQTAYLVGNTHEPAWLLIAFAVFGYAGTATGLTAKANAPRTTKP